MRVERAGLQALDAQALAAVRAPEVGVTEFEFDIARAQQVRRAAPVRRRDIELGGVQAQAADEAHAKRFVVYDPRVRVEATAIGEHDTAFEPLRQQPLHRHRQKRPAEPLTDGHGRSQGQQRGGDRVGPAPWRRCQARRPRVHAAALRGERIAADIASIDTANRFSSALFWVWILMRSSGIQQSPMLGPARTRRHR